MSARVRWLIGIMVAGHLAYAWGLVGVDRPTSGFSSFWDGQLYFAVAALVVVSLVVRAVDDPDRRDVWLLIAAGVASTFVADLVFTYHDQNLEQWSFPSASDVAYLMAYPLWAAGIARLAFRGRPGREGRWRSQMLDGFTLGLTVGALAAARWFQPILDQSGDAAEVRMGITFALLDLVLIVVAVASLAPQGYRPSPAALGLVVAAATFGLGDILYLSTIVSDEYVAGSLLDVWWALGLLWFGIAAWLPATPRAQPDPAKELATGLVPALSALGALGIVAVALAGGAPSLAAWLAIGAVALALVRLVWTLRELRTANEHFRQARTDDLTGLPNRRAFMEAVDVLLEDDAEVVVLMLDLDGFKEVNDSLGHQAGDELLEQVAGRMAAELSDGVVLARLGGDEFGLAAPRRHGDGVGHAQRLLTELERPLELGGLDVRISASIGIATSRGASREELLRMADVAMYEAKRLGIRHAHYDERADPHGRDRLQLIGDLREAMESEAFELAFQPVVDVATGRVEAVEALIRWTHPVRGVVDPATFIPLAERSGLIPRITRIVLARAAEQLAELRRLGHHQAMSVNVSAKDLVDEGLADHLVATMALHDVPADQLVLEITETALTDDPVRSRRTLDALRSAGVQIAIDDFGVGYSSLAKLLELPVDQIKLDRSFVTPIDHDRRAQAIVRSTVELARTLGLTVVAEGIETEGALRFVAEHGVDRVQGFLVQAPLDGPSLLRYLVEHPVALAPAHEPLPADIRPAGRVRP